MRGRHCCSIGIILIWVLCLITGCGEKAAETKTTREIFAMDTIMELTVYGERGEEAVTEAVRLINRLDRLFSVTDKESDISKINAAGGEPVKVAEETYELIERSKEYSAETDGAFDISIYPLVRAWGFTTEKQQVPTRKEREEAMKKIDYRRIQCLPDCQIQLEPGMEIDLGAVAKGYVSQKIMDLWKQRGVTSAIVSLGGNVQTMGKKEDGSSYQVGITDPADAGGLFGTMAVEDRAVVTSGIYQRNFTERGVFYHHIMNASTGMPAENDLASVTVITEDGTKADALATALFVMGGEEIEKYQKSHPDIQVLYIRKDGTSWQSEEVNLSH